MGPWSWERAAEQSRLVRDLGSNFYGWSGWSGDDFEDLDKCQLILAAGMAVPDYILPLELECLHVVSGTIVSKRICKASDCSTLSKVNLSTLMMYSLSQYWSTPRAISQRTVPA